MFVTLAKKDRPTKGFRAFTDEEEQEIYRLITEENAKAEEIAVWCGVSFPTVKNALKRQKKAREITAA